jgi:hypothetical protein
MGKKKGSKNNYPQQNQKYISPTCADCSMTKEVALQKSDVYKTYMPKGKLQPLWRCKNCHTRRTNFNQLWKKIKNKPLVGDYDEVFNFYRTRNPDQNCQICTTKKATEYDHHHESGLFRGWLCVGCNTGIGQFEENQARMVLACTYIQTFLDDHCCWNGPQQENLVVIACGCIVCSVCEVNYQTCENCTE